MYFDAEYLNDWEAIGNNDVRRTEQDKCRTGGRVIDRYEYIERNAVRFAVYSEAVVSCKGAVDTDERGS